MANTRWKGASCRQQLQATSSEIFTMATNTKNAAIAQDSPTATREASVSGQSRTGT